MEELSLKLDRVNAASSADAAPFTIRFLRIDGLPWYAASEICAKLELPLEATLAEKVADCHKRLEAATNPDGSDGPEEWFISPIGAWTLTLYLKRTVDYAFQRWIFPATKAIEPDAFDRAKHGKAQMMALRPDGDVPPRPHPRSGRADERDALKHLPEYISPMERRNGLGVVGWLRQQEVRDRQHADMDAIFSDIKADMESARA